MAEEKKEDEIQFDELIVFPLWQIFLGIIIFLIIFILIFLFVYRGMLCVM